MALVYVEESIAYECRCTCVCLLQVLRPGGRVFFRDFARMDRAQVLPVHSRAHIIIHSE